ncbi:DCN1-like protein 5 [Lunasporangiospora selenospora]|uniref:Defective in cullin neddylation protein n=1 Tax=Lunasporangiospora selenospora TaxID=979761 RepID=A0A9P6KDX1_9FUNG|nr:DCN1-like protein 5 [Lunasporangiospora selenospora]
MPPKRKNAEADTANGGSRVKAAKTTSRASTKKAQPRGSKGEGAHSAVRLSWGTKTAQYGIPTNQEEQRSTLPTRQSDTRKTTTTLTKSNYGENHVVSGKPASQSPQSSLPNPSVAVSREGVFSPERCSAWFKTYAGLEDEFDPDLIGPAGIGKLCEDIDVSLATVDMLVLAYHLVADSMPIFTKDEWMKGMEKLGIDSTSKLKTKMPELVANLKNPQHFKEFYRYVFMFAKDSDQKCMPIETALGMLMTVMEGRPHMKAFVEFLEAKKPVKVINRDQWYNFLDFSDTISEDLSNYDGASSAWPVLLDEYVEWRTEESA